MRSDLEINCGVVKKRTAALRKERSGMAEEKEKRKEDEEEKVKT